MSTDEVSYLFYKTVTKYLDNTLSKHICFKVYPR